MKKIRSALISLSDKSNLKPLLQELRRNNIKIISSGGTFKAIKKLKFKCLDVSDFTGFKEILEGQHDDVPENDFLYKGSIDEVVAKSKGQ